MIKKVAVAFLGCSLMVAPLNASFLDYGSGLRKTLRVLAVAGAASYGTDRVLHAIKTCNIFSPARATVYATNSPLYTFLCAMVSSIASYLFAYHLSKSVSD